MGTLLDTHILVWAARGGSRLSRAAQDIIENSGQLLISVVTAWEYVDLQQRRRIPPAVGFAEVRAALGAEVLDLPHNLWTVAASLPDFHGDPVDRMLIAHAMLDALPLITADAAIRRYPIATIW